MSKFTKSPSQQDKGGEGNKHKPPNTIQALREK